MSFIGKVYIDQRFSKLLITIRVDYIRKTLQSVRKYLIFMSDLSKNRMGRGELCIAIAGLVVLLWLHGNLLFFWDTVLPFHPVSDIYFYSFTWNQAIFNGAPSQTNEWFSYFVIFYILHSLMGFSLPLSQFILFYSLFTLSGITMYRLIKFLALENNNANLFLPALAGALVYMFNFYTGGYLLSDFFESWFLYSLLPLIILIFYSGIRKSTNKEPYWSDILWLIVLFEVISVSFWEEPYLIWTFFILIFFILSYIFRNGFIRKREKYISVIKFLFVSISSIIITGLWYIYPYVNNVFMDLKAISPSGRGGTLAAYQILVTSLNSAGPNPFMRAFHLLAIYPTYTPAPGGLEVWQNIYLPSLSPMNIIMFVSAFTFLIAVFFPLLQKGSLKNRILSNNWLYGFIFVLVFFGLQGINPFLRWITYLLLIVKFPYFSILYGTNFQFLGFPFIFLYSIAVSKTILSLTDFSRKGNNVKSYHKDRGIKESKIYTFKFSRKHIRLITFVLLIMIIVVYPWYMWTPYATPVYNTGYNQEIVPSVVNLPSYVYKMTDFIQANANNSNTLILPTSNNFLTMGFNGSSFADDQYPALMLGAPVLFQTQIAHNNVTSDIQYLIYNPLVLGNHLSNYLSELDVKFIILNKDFVAGAGNYLYENITYLQGMLQNQPNIRLVHTFGPIQVYENMQNTGIIQIGSAVHFSPTDSKPYGKLSILNNFTTDGLSHSPLPPVTYNTTSNGSIILENNKLISTVNPVYFFNNNPLNINETAYHYLSITFKSSSRNVSLYVDTTTGFSNSSYGNSILQPLNLSSNTLSQQLYVNSTNYRTYIYPLFGQSSSWYSTYNNTNNYTLKKIILSLSFNKLFGNESGSIEIISMNVLKYINHNENYYYLASNLNSSSQVLVQNNIYTNNTSLNKASITYKEINPTKYIVNVRNATDPFVLDFKQNFNFGWFLYINGTKINSNHFAADIYNNGWLISQRGNYTIEIVYASQRNYEIITDISLYSLIFIVTSILAYTSYRYYIKTHKYAMKQH